MPYTPTPVFPGAAITREALIIAGNGDVLDLAADIDGSQGTLQVGTGEGVRAVVGQSFTIDQEAVQVTAIVGDVLTITRGFDNTTPAPHSAGSDKVVDRPIAKHHNQPADELAALEAFLTTGFTRDVNAGGKRIINAANARASPTGDQDYTTLDDVLALLAAPYGPGRFTNHFLLMGY